MLRYSNLLANLKITQTLRLHNTTPYKVGVVVHPLEVEDDHDFRLTTSGGGVRKWQARSIRAQKARPHLVRGSVGDAVEMEVALALWAVRFLYALTVRRFSAVVVTLLRQVGRSWSSDSHVLGLMSRSLRERVLALTEFSIQ